MTNIRTGWRYAIARPIEASRIGVFFALVWIATLVFDRNAYLLPVACSGAMLSMWILTFAVFGRPWALAIFLAVVLIVPNISFQSRELGTLSMNPQNILKLSLWFAMAVVALFRFRVYAFLLRHQLIWPILAFGMLGIGSVLISPVPAYSLASVLGFVSTLAFACLIAVELPETLIFKVVLWSFAGYVAMNLLAVVALPDTSWMSPDGGDEAYRLQGLSSHPNVLAKEMAAFLCLLYPLAIRQRRIGQISPLMIYGLTFAGVLVILASGSRSSLVALCAASVLPVILWSSYSRMMTISSLILIALGVLALSTGSVPDMRTVLDALSRSGDASEILTATGRTELWSYVWEKYLESPIFGHGFDSAEYVLEHDWWGAPDAGIGAHNAVLQSLLTTGLAGTCFFVLWTLFLVRSLLVFADAVTHYITVYLIILGLTEVEIIIHPVLLTVVVFLAAAMEANTQISRLDKS